MKRVCATLLLFFPLLAYSAPYWAVSDVHTFHFGVEVDRPNSTRIDARHVDINLPFCGGGGQFNILADPPPLSELFLPSAAHLYANANTRLNMPNPVFPGYEFLGVAPGATFWQLEQSQQSGELYLGIESSVPLSRLAAWNPNVPGRATTLNKWLEVRLVAVRGPPGSNFSMYQYGSPSPRVYWATSNGITLDDRVFISAGGHDHFNWAFSHSGLYEVDIQVATFIEDTSTAFPILPVTGHPDLPLLRWQSDPCYRYTVQWTSHLLPPVSWTDLPGAIGLPGLPVEMLFPVPLIPPEERRYFRIHRVP